jgi:hypothetical protein
MEIFLRSGRYRHCEKPIPTKKIFGPQKMSFKLNFTIIYDNDRTLKRICYIMKKTKSSKNEKNRVISTKFGGF